MCIIQVKNGTNLSLRPFGHKRVNSFTGSTVQEIQILEPQILGLYKGRFLSESVTNFSNCQTNMPNHYLKLEFLKLNFKELFFSVTGSQLS